MVVGIIGVGVVGGTLKQWFEKYTSHDIRCYDPNKGMNDSLEGCEAIFISVPVKPAYNGQDTSILIDAIRLAKKHTDFVFIRSTVLPGTNDNLGTISMPEFLTERTAFADMEKLPVVVGKCSDKLMERLFPGKEICMFTNCEAELAKYTHNCFGALKVTYFNLIYDMCTKIGADFESVKLAAGITGFIGTTHTQVPGPDGYFGYGGKCFPENVEAFSEYLREGDAAPYLFFRIIEELNKFYRNKTETFAKEVSA